MSRVSLGDALNVTEEMIRGDDTIKKITVVLLVFFLFGIFVSATAQEIYWGDSVPEGWRGTWPVKYLTTPEKTSFERTTSSSEILEFVNVLRWNSEHVHVINMYTSPMGRICSAVVLANPRVTTPEEAAKSGKTVIYLQGNIHPAEADAKEALLMIMREILFGRMLHLLDNLIIIVASNFNVDGNDILNLNHGTPHLLGVNSNSQNLNLNRDAVKVDSVEVTGLYRTIFNRWDPILIYDGHAMGRVQHGYAMGYATCTVPASHPGPRNYVFEKLFPAVRESARKNFGLEMFTHCGFDLEWPPTVWGHFEGWWSNEAKFVANAYGLRNRMTILAESPGHESFERKIYAHYAFVTEVLEFTRTHAWEMQDICRRTDQEIVETVKAKAGSGGLENYVAGKYESYGKVDVLAYRERNVSDYVSGTSVRAKIPDHMLGPPEVVKGVEFMAKPIGTAKAKMPRGYLIPAEMEFIVEKLRTHNVRVDVLEKPIKVSGEEFVVDRIVHRPGGPRQDAPFSLEGGFAQSPVKEFPAGTFRVDMAQPSANLAFYCLEPQAADGFVGWGVMDEHLRSLGADVRSVVYPVYKYFKILECSIGSGSSPINQEKEIDIK